MNEEKLRVSKLNKILKDEIFFKSEKQEKIFI